MTREVRGATWPLPWWWVALPALWVAGNTAWSVLTATDWLYYPMPLVSALSRDGLQVTGPVLMVMATAVSQAALDRNSVSSHLSSVRAGRSLPLRSLAVFGGWALLGYAIGAAGPLWFLSQRTVAGSVSWIVPAVGAAALMVFVVAGFVVGSIVRSWPGPLASAGVALVFLVGPVMALSEAPDLPAVVAWLSFLPVGGPGEAIPVSSGLLVLVWWVVLTGALCALYVAVQRSRARILHRSAQGALVGSVALVPVTAVALVLANPPMVAAQGLGVQCRTVSSGGQVCVLVDETPVLDDLVAEVELTLARVGDPELGRWAFASQRALPAVRAQNPGVEVISGSITPDRGTEYTDEGLGAWLSGLNACGTSATGAGRGLDWSYGVAIWATRPEQVAEMVRISSGRPAAELRPDEKVVLAAEEDVRAWYAENQQELMACAYDGEGPGVDGES